MWLGSIYDTGTNWAENMNIKFSRGTPTAEIPEQVTGNDSDWMTQMDSSNL